MNTNNYDIAMKYYDAMLNKEFDVMENCLHPEIHFISPLMELRDKEKIVESAKSLSNILENIEVRAKFVEDNRLMMAYDFMLKNNKLRSAVLMEFKDSLISKIELFFDSGSFR